MAINDWNKLKREAIIALCGALITSILLGIGWALVDRIQIQAWVKQVDVDAGRIDTVEKRLGQIPFDPVLAQEVSRIEKNVDAQHEESMTELRDLSHRVDELLLLARSKRGRTDDPPAVPAKAGKLK